MWVFPIASLPMRAGGFQWLSPVNKARFPATGNVTQRKRRSGAPQASANKSNRVLFYIFYVRRNFARTAANQQPTAIT